MRVFVRALVFLGLASAAQAQTALVVGSLDEAAARPVGASRYVAPMVEHLSASGLEVLYAADPEGTDLHALFAGLAGREDEPRLLITLSGRFVNFSGLNWYLAHDAGEVDVAELTSVGVPVEYVLALAGQISDDAVVLLAPEDQLAPLGPGLSNGLTEIEAPQDVTLAVGTPVQVARFVTESLLAPGAGLQEAFGQVPGLDVLVLPRPNRPFIPEPNIPPVDAGELTYWTAMATLDNVFSYQAYLNRYPNGYFAQEARRRLQALQNAVPEPTPQEIEAALNLSRDQKRGIQRDLAVLGHYNSGIDGLFGPGTRGGIRAWQQVNGLQVTGYLNANQIGRLHNQAEQRRAQILAEDRAYWTQTGQGNDEAGLRAYLDRYPNGTFADLARDRLAAIEAEQARQADLAYWNQTGRGQTEQGLRAYLQRYPEGEFSQLARQRLRSILEQREAQVWQQVIAANTVQAYRAYLRDYPNGPHAAQARQRLQQLEQAAGEPAAWDAARNADTIEAYRDYLNSYPNGPHRQQALNRIDRIQADNQAWAAAVQADTIDAYRDYLNHDPDPRRRDQALQRVEAIRADNQAWRAARNANTADAYRQYLQDFPDGRRAEEAQQRLDALAPPNSDPEQMNPIQLQLAARGLINAEYINAAQAQNPNNIVAALRRYQQENGLPVSGVMDPPTVAHMTVNGLLSR